MNGRRRFGRVKGTLIKQMTLDNGLTLEMYDLPKPVAGDRWLVSFEARIEVSVKPEYFAGKSEASVDLGDIQALLGETVIYRYTKERNFIAESQKDTVLNVLEEHFLDTTLRYLSSPEFPRRLILRRYQEALSQQCQSRPVAYDGKLKYYH